MVEQTTFADCDNFDIVPNNTFTAETPGTKASVTDISQSDTAETATEKIDRLGKREIGKSSLVLFHRPSKKTLPLLKERKGVTLVVTVQAESEKPEEVQKLCTDNGLKHLWIELEGANEALLTYKMADHF